MRVNVDGASEFVGLEVVTDVDRYTVRGLVWFHGEVVDLPGDGSVDPRAHSVVL